MSTQAYGRRGGWITFAAILMFAVGFARIIAAFTYFDDSNDVNDLTNSIFGDDLWAAGSGISSSPHSRSSQAGHCSEGAGSGR